MITKKDREFIYRAIELSEKGMNNNAGGPFGAVIVKDDKIIAEGYNQVTSSNDPTAHAEIVAIREACRNLNSFQLDGCIIYTSCEPCPMCLGALYWARPAKIYYGNTKNDAADIGFDDSFIYEELALPMDQRKLPVIPLLRNEALAAFKAWAEKSDKTEY